MRTLGACELWVHVELFGAVPCLLLVWFFPRMRPTSLLSTLVSTHRERLLSVPDCSVCFFALLLVLLCNPRVLDSAFAVLLAVAVFLRTAIAATRWRGAVWL
eukprot:TRINITY_DN1493_c0_g2_i2.p5 TRINITY_DN1493_c0_g2~~TRINITY_DN1493_c0_g2_i2.p5  ORF type:complete len:102 (-),score=2.94 TRINITY_DN1493_c0_g2_i2:962-1267(-)